jgi:hypothetical protein
VWGFGIGECEQRYDVLPQIPGSLKVNHWLKTSQPGAHLHLTSLLALIPPATALPSPLVSIRSCGSLTQPLLTISGNTH